MSVTIQTKDLVKKYGSRTVVNHVSFNVSQGEIVGLLGPNGAGKTTSFYQVVGLVKPDEGRVFLNDLDITSLPMYKRAQMGIGYLPQEASVFRKLSVEDNISAVLEMTKLTRQQQRDKLEALLNEFRLQHVRKSNGDVLSGGERRRTEIARALSVDPKFILLDEPFAGIDPIAVEDIQSVVAKLKYKNIGILITDHNVTETLSICDRAYLLIEGKIYKHGTAEELANDDEVKRLYLGRNFELKRKDWLHEEAREEKISDEEKLSTSVNSRVLLQFLKNSSERTTQLLEVIRNIISGKGGATMNFDLPVPEYLQQLRELKKSLTMYSEAKQHKELLQNATRIDDIDFKEYKFLFSLDDAARTTGSPLIKFITSSLNKRKLVKLEGLLTETNSALGNCINFLTADLDS